VTEDLALKPTPVARFWAPRFWPSWGALGLLWGLTRLPYRWQLGLGRALGWALLQLSLTRRRVAETNLRLCFPELSLKQRRRLLVRHFESLGTGLVEIAMSWWASDDQLRPFASIDGLGHLQQALQQGKGAILLSAHFTSLEMGGRLLTLHVPLHALYRPAKNPLFQSVMHRARERHVEKAIPYHDVRALLKSLKDNGAVWFAPDQHHGGKHKAFVPFFGVLAATNTSTSRLARMSGAPVIPFFVCRLPGGGYQLKLSPPLVNFPSDDPVRDTLRINQLIENEVRRVPEQYLWVHRRFRRRPPGEPRIYRD
jgi:KDO2-lipid IV(A) lauroyltransferase